MTGLLIKDWKLLKSQGKFFLTVVLFAVIIIFMNSWEYTSFATSYMTFLITMFTLSTFSYDEAGQGMCFLLSLPVSRKSFVREKYLFGVLLAGTTWILSIAIRFLFLLIQSPTEFWFHFVGTEPIFLAVVFIFLGYSLPLMFQFGAEKGRMVSFAILFGIFALIVIFGFLHTMTAAAENLANASMGILNVAAVIFSVLFLIGSYFISLKIIEKKEY